MSAFLTVCQRCHIFSPSPLRSKPLLWNFSASYTRVSAEDKLGIDKPKKPLTSFIKFSSQIRPTLVAKNPGTSASDILKMASQHWQKLGTDVKEKLSKEYEKEMVEYKKIKAKYDASLSEEQKQNIKRMQEEILEAKEKRKLKAEYKENDRPKKSMPSYFLFCQKQRNSSTENLSMVEFQMKMKEKWHSLPDAEKLIYTNEALKLKDEYRKKLTLWEEKMIRVGNIGLVKANPRKNSTKSAA